LLDLKQSIYRFWGLLDSWLAAIERIKKARPGIRQVSKKEPALPPKLLCSLLEKISPSMAAVDSSSGALDNPAAAIRYAEATKGINQPVAEDGSLS